MDYKIYNIELVNRLSAWQHTAFKTKTSIPIALPGREREPATKAGEPPPDQQEPVDPLNVITWDAADFVLCHKVRCSFRCLPTRCRGPPPRLNFPKFRRNGGTAMRYRNNGAGGGQYPAKSVYHLFGDSHPLAEDHLSEKAHEAGDA